MKITVMTALAAATLALAPMAQAQEGNSDPFPFSAGPIAAVRFTDGVAVALPDQPAPAYAALDGDPFPFSAGPIRATPFTDGIDVALPPARPGLRRARRSAASARHRGGRAAGRAPPRPE